MSSLRPTTDNVIDLDAYRVQAMATGRSPSVPVLDTSEVRWFAEGLPPDTVVDWFTSSGAAGTLEERCDTYQLHRLHDIGVKRRARTSLEVKVRRGIGDPLVVAPGLVAPFEEWRKWSPGLGDPMSPSEGTPWIDVDKAVLTRTVSADHEVVGPALHVDDQLSGCDVEIVAVTVAGVEAWSFAFEAFGPKRYRSRAVRSAWEMLIDTSGAAEELSADLTFAGGYPEWLAHIASILEHRSAQRHQDHYGM